MLLNGLRLSQCLVGHKDKSRIERARRSFEHGTVAALAITRRSLVVGVVVGGVIKEGRRMCK